MVVIRHSFGITDAIKSAEYPTAVPTSRIRFGATSVTIVFKSDAVSLRMIGTLVLHSILSDRLNKRSVSLGQEFI